jgi:aspartokinase-like uncharacterized kinase
MHRRVIKLGGSLLDFGGLQAALREWLALQPPAANVLIVGGGPLVDVVHDLDRRLGLGEEAAHWLSIRAMGVTARLANALWPEFKLVTQWAALREAMGSSPTPIVFDAEEFLRRHEPQAPGATLERSWSVTSDSIAARVAAALPAAELVLLKSSLPDRSFISHAEAASLGYVDPFFPRVARSLPHVRAVQFRSPEFHEIDLAPAS